MSFKIKNTNTFFIFNHTFLNMKWEEICVNKPFVNWHIHRNGTISAKRESNELGPG